MLHYLSGLWSKCRGYFYPQNPMISLLQGQIQHLQTRVAKNAELIGQMEELHDHFTKKTPDMHKFAGHILTLIQPQNPEPPAKKLKPIDQTMLEAKMQMVLSLILGANQGGQGLEDNLSKMKKDAVDNLTKKRGDIAELKGTLRGLGQSLELYRSFLASRQQTVNQLRSVTQQFRQATPPSSKSRGRGV